MLCVSTIREGEENTASNLEDRAFLTARTLTKYVPPALGGIIVNSTNMKDRENVDALALSRLREFKNPWRISSRVGHPVLQATLNIWNGQPENYKLGQDTFRCLLKNMERQQKQLIEKSKQAVQQ